MFVHVPSEANDACVLAGRLAVADPGGGGGGGGVQGVWTPPSNLNMNIISVDVSHVRNTCYGVHFVKLLNSLFLLLIHW